MTFEDALSQLHRYEILACAVPSGDPSRCAWVGVHPFDRYGIEPHRAAKVGVPGAIYRILWIEIPRDFDYEQFDLHPEYITTIHDIAVASDDQLRKTLLELDVDPDALNFTNIVRYPL